MMFYFGKYLVLNMYYIKDYIHDKFFNIKLESIHTTFLSAIHDQIPYSQKNI